MQIKHTEKKKIKPLAIVIQKYSLYPWPVEIFSHSFFDKWTDFYKIHLWIFNVTIYKTYGEKSQYTITYEMKKLQVKENKKLHLVYISTNTISLIRVVIKKLMKSFFYSYHCPVQNRNIYNIYISVMFVYIIAIFKENKWYTSVIVHHKYLLSGHIHGGRYNSCTNRKKMQLN